MVRDGLDKRFRQVALDGLKSFRHMEFTVRFLNRHKVPDSRTLTQIRHKLPVSRTLTQMWADIQTWLNQGDDSRCLALLEYVDDLKLWGRQRIFLFEINGEQKDFTTQLSDPDFVRDLVGDVYDKPIYRWEAEKPFLAQVKHTSDPYTGAPLLVFKLIEMRPFDLLIDGREQRYDERSTNFFIVNLRDGFAELRLQQLPKGACRRLREESRLFKEEIRKYLKFDRFEPILVEPIMGEMLRRPIYTITSTEFISGKDVIPGMPTLAIVLNHLFKHPIPSRMAAYWKCNQDVLGVSRMHFRLYGGNDSIAFGGVSDPYRVSDILKKIVDIHRHEDIEEKETPWKRGLVDELYKRLEGQPKAQAVVLATGAIAALVIWVVIEGTGNYLLENWVERILRGVPLVAITILIELVWILRFYGWNRIKRSFGALRSMPLHQIWRAVKKAKKYDKNRHIANDEDKDGGSI